MITKVVFGIPIQTEAITAEVQETSAVNYFSVNQSKKQIVFTYKLEKDDVVYGLGETMGRVNKRVERQTHSNWKSDYKHKRY